MDWIVCSLVIQHAVRMYLILVLSVAFPVVQNFSTLSQEPYDYRQKVTKLKICDLIFSTTFVWNVSHSKKNWARYDRKCISVYFMWSDHYTCQILIKLERTWQIYENCSNTKFHENPSSVSWVVPRGSTDRETESANSRFSQFWWTRLKNPAS
jgi:hypothetical protein